MQSVNLFVYGTLKKGQPNHELLEAEIREGFAEYLGEGTLQGFVLYDRGNFPVAVPGPGTVHGECYRIPRELLVGELDQREGFPHGFIIAPPPRWGPGGVARDPGRSPRTVKPDE